MTSALEIHDLHFRRPDGFSLRIPELVLDPGERILVSGPSGCGKSTLLLLAAGLLDAEHGRILVGGEDLTRLGSAACDALRARRIGMVFQTHHLLPGFTARENVSLALLFAGVPAREHGERAGRLLSSLGIDRPDARVDRQSVGQQQRVAIARALAAEPDIILADEPTASLDPTNARSAVDLLQKSCEEHGTALLLTSHDPDLSDLLPRSVDFDDLLLAVEATS